MSLPSLNPVSCMMKKRTKKQEIGIRPMEARLWVLLLSILIFVPYEPLRADEQKKVEAPSFEGKILGMEITADALALVVDISSSMRPFLPSIRKELREKTPRNPVLHVYGCGIERPDPRPRIENGVAPETITAIDALATHTTAWTILWITDMADPPNVDGVASLEKLLGDRGLQLLLISVENRPPPSVQKVIEAREGYWKVLDPEKLR